MSGAGNSDGSAGAGHAHSEADEQVTVGELSFATALFAVAVGVGVMAFGLDGREAVWPQFLSVLFVALTGGDLIVTVLKWRAQAGTAIEPAESSESDSPLQRVLMCGWLFVFAVIGTQIGFGWATIALVPIYQLMKGRRNPIMITAITAGLVVGFHLLFDVVAGIPIW